MWRRTTQDPNGFVRTFDATGLPTSGAKKRTGPQGQVFTAHDAIALDDGGFAVAWSAQGVSDAPDQLMLERISAKGESQDLQVVADGAGPVAVTVLAGGDLAIAWGEVHSTSLPSPLLLRRYSAAGEPEGPTVTVLGAPSGPKGSVPILDIAPLKDGGLLFAWPQEDQTIHVIASDADGTPRGAPSALGSGHRTLGGLAAQGDGAVAIWEKFYEPSGWRGSIHATPVTAAGAPGEATPLSPGCTTCVAYEPARLTPDEVLSVWIRSDLPGYGAATPAEVRGWVVP